MILSEMTKAIVRNSVQTLIAQLAVFIGADANIPATSRNVLKDGREALREISAAEFDKLDCQILANNCGMSWSEHQQFLALPFREKVIFLVDRHTREFAAHWLMLEFHEVYWRLQDAQETVDDICYAYWNDTYPSLPLPRLIDWIEES